MQLHVFADASTKAYGAVVFLTCSDQTTFVMAKGRVAPLKPVTLPKLELMAAVIAAKLAKFVLDSLRIDIVTHLWNCAILATEHKISTTVYQASGKRDKQINPQCYLETLSKCC